MALWRPTDDGTKDWAYPGLGCDPQLIPRYRKVLCPPPREDLIQSPHARRVHRPRLPGQPKELIQRGTFFESDRGGIYGYRIDHVELRQAAQRLSTKISPETP